MQYTVNSHTNVPPNILITYCQRVYPQGISFCKTEEVKISIPRSLELLLIKATSRELCLPLSGERYTINITVRETCTEFTYEITVLLALVATIKCYPVG